jgi:hypothetical protein
MWRPSASTSTQQCGTSCPARRHCRSRRPCRAELPVARVAGPASKEPDEVWAGGPNCNRAMSRRGPAPPIAVCTDPSMVCRCRKGLVVEWGQPGGSRARGTCPFRCRSRSPRHEGMRGGESLRWRGAFVAACTCCRCTNSALVLAPTRRKPPPNPTVHHTAWGNTGRSSHSLRLVRKGRLSRLARTKRSGRAVAMGLEARAWLARSRRRTRSLDRRWRLEARAGPTLGSQEGRPRTGERGPGAPCEASHAPLGLLFFLGRVFE